MGPKAARLTKLSGLFGLVAIATTGCSAGDVLRFGWPEGITPQATDMRQLWTWSVIAALVVGVIVWALILWPVIFHRKRGDEMPRQTQYNVPLEIVYTVIPVVMISVLFYFTAVTQNYVTNTEDDPDVTVDVVAFQWNWEFRYQGYTTPDGDEVSTIGTSDEIPLLVLPTDQVIQYELYSNDVIHSFWVPEFLFKRDNIPNPEANNQDNVFQNTIDRSGSFVGRCAELCGSYHAMMNFEVRALPTDLFDQYMGLRTQDNPTTGAPYTAAEALTEMDCGELCAPQAVTTYPFETDRTAREASTRDGN
ncbi:cytochrome c oxidase subunit II [Actinoalloteichus sp. AHMU CJ021]|uniref:cytochrome-c oxidase n=1 Tax=Actinoalloteichus caeruleus DSM 43889 TaxID=1120930 RepID=A0ABT1JHC9_ACTCY|nr:cytochrome c oxidase subunit II [Actinoalloteichus caeruleus]AUS77929.1 cytochrome c oxidase subunit II [Actinoalloteichus sp. AHMU CJ021]MCP2331895.1 cytochrome c oxidase subunit 2 [Actinoalloteichus caeruleus DSM 43889]